MFTGLIQGLGTVRSLSDDRFAISLSNILLDDLALGDSVAVDGVCLTVETLLDDGFIATASPETLQRTTLGQRLRSADWVNLEPSLRVGSKLGGHFVTGHIDGIGCLVESLATDKAWEMTFAAPPNAQEQWQQFIAPFLIGKGSIAVNGISLTIADTDESRYFKVAVIPVTYQETNLSLLKFGDLVNLEADILGKYVAKLLGHRLPPQSASSEISLAFLSENGYL